MPIANMLRRSSKPALAAAVLLLFAAAEHISAFRFTDVPPLEPAYRVLAMQPPGALIEMPPLSAAKAYTRTQYMLNSTVHWMPLVNAYSDYTPEDFSRNLGVLAGFPSAAAFEVLPAGVRYATFHIEEYKKNGVMDTLTNSLEAFSPYLRRVYADDRIWLFEITGRPQAR